MKIIRFAIPCINGGRDKLGFTYRQIFRRCRAEKRSYYFSCAADSFAIYDIDFGSSVS